MLRLLSLGAIALFAIGIATPQRGLPRGEDLTQYRTWKCITPQAVDMPMQIALRCVVPPSWDQAPSPHINYVFKIYVNPIGAAAMTSNKSIPFPVGSVIVKEKFAVKDAKVTWDRHKIAPNAKPEMLTVMTKQAKGFDTPNGDWEYKVLNGSMTKETSTGLEYCAKCHSSAANRDFVYYRKANHPDPEGGYDFVKKPHT